MEHAVLIHLPLKCQFGTDGEKEEVQNLEEELASVVEAPSVGEFDGNEFGASKCVLFLYGTNADRLFKAIEPVLKATPIASGGYAIKRYGAANHPRAREKRVT